MSQWPEVTGIIPALAGNTWAAVGQGSPNKDHPRSRGEYYFNCSQYRVGSGSSPLSRGIRLDPRADGARIRIIPALAGNTFNMTQKRQLCWDHPRSRGEYYWRSSNLVLTEGSSPLSRGIRPLGPSVSGWVGIIPALAGNTSPRPIFQYPDWDHPRSRGEYSRAPLPGTCTAGSSPLSRGIPSTSGPDKLFDRIIPALAGNTRAAWHTRTDRTDHPRSRGEYEPHRTSMGSPGGSSPLSRGIRPCGRNDTRCHRIIPALAGNTFRPPQPMIEWWDHPRSRGEYAITADQQAGRWGSSPLSRGIPSWRLYNAAVLRIIPALAGNTSGLRSRLARSWDHPRSRGEYRLVEDTALAKSGSSPLSRGILEQELHSVAEIGIIPALAGNTPHE